MDCFIKKVWNNKVDEKTHKQFIRFGKGTFENRALLSMNIKKDIIELRGSFEYANDFVLFVATLGNLKFKGVVLSKEKLENLNGRKKGEVYEYNFSGNSEDVKKIYNKSYYMLLDVENGVKLKIKKKLPKPGKNKEIKIDDKFCYLCIDRKYKDKIKETFLWDVGEGKRVKVIHTYKIEEIKIPKNEKDFEQMRLKAIRKGKIIRKIIIDGKEIVKEKEFEA